MIRLRSQICSAACLLLVIQVLRFATVQLVISDDGSSQAQGTRTQFDDSGGSSDFPVVENSATESQLAPMAPEDAARAMQLPEGFRVSVFASEPDVQNPIAMTWDEKGRLWIAENYTYSDRSERFDLSLRDRVLIFEDQDGDGVADSRKVFTDKVQMLTSVETGHGGVWLMCPPQLLFLPDADGDDLPDGPAEVILDGFEVAEANYHNFANGLRWGPDGWLYGRCGHSCPGRIGVPGTPLELRPPLDGGIWRFHPERKIVEVLCHGTVNPWGHDWDTDGELFFINTVIGHLWHMLPGSHFKESFGESMNAHVYERMDTIADHYHFDTGKNWSDSRYGKANELGGGHAHIGMLIYQGDQWPDYYRHKLLTLNMHGRRANVDRLERIGSGYVGRHEPDFLISNDPFFRGLDLSVGPDGNVFVIDWSDTGECHEHDGVHRLSGRIFKISYGDQSNRAQVVKPLCLRGSGPLPELWREYQSGTITPSTIRTLENDPDEHVRVWAIRLLTDFWPLDWITGPAANAVYPDDSATHEMLVRMARDDRSGLVQRVLASTLQRLPVEHRARLAAELVKRETIVQDRQLELLIWFGLSPVGDRQPESLVQLARDCRSPVVIYSIARNLAMRLNSESEPLNQLLIAATSLEPALQVQVLAGMQDALRGWRAAPEPKNWRVFSQAASSGTSDSIRELSVLFGDGRALSEVQAVAMNPAAELKTRQQALRTFIDARPDNLRDVCEALLDIRHLNGVAARGLFLFNDAEVAELLIRKYGRFHPEDKPKIIEGLVSRSVFANVLLNEISSQRGAIRVGDISAADARQILSLGDDTLTRKLNEVWGHLRDTPTDRAQFIQSTKSSLTRAVLEAADLGHGRLLFQKTCSQCHQLFGNGERVGPDLTGSQRANLDYLLTNIFDPSAVVSKDYRMSTLALVDGRVMNGLVISRDDQRTVIRTATEKLTLPTADIEAIRDSPLSVMPDGLVQNLTDEQLRDLIAYLMQPVQVDLPPDQIDD